MPKHNFQIHVQSLRDTSQSASTFHLTRNDELVEFWQLTAGVAQGQAYHGVDNTNNNTRPDPDERYNNPSGKERFAVDIASAEECERHQNNRTEEKNAIRDPRDTLPFFRKDGIHRLDIVRFKVGD